ncbi:hypothetical protein ACILE9_06835 [Capnocytophaga cynodegmi]|uniref:hypothetical protein n=1 Tax=Capnocytophaga cynodegmi TaxID=28189 RepID=UPI0037D3546D
MIKKLTTIICVATATLVMSCSKNDDKNDNTQQLYWEMEGQRFTAQGGKAFDNGNSISVYVTSHQSDCSSKEYNFENYLNVEIPKNSKTEGYNVVFGRKGSIPMNALNSKIRYEHNGEQITIWVDAKTISGHKAEGKYTVPYCK